MTVHAVRTRRSFRLLRLAVPLALIISALAAAISAGSPHAAQAVSAPVTFGRPATVSVGQEGFEPDLRIAPTTQTNGSNQVTIPADSLISSVPNGFATTISFMWRSLDHGQSWRLVPASSADGTGKLPTCVGGGDTENVFDSMDRLYFNDLQGLTNFSTSRSTDLGQTFQTDCTSTINTGVDRQWYAVDGDPLNGGHIFLAYDQVAQSTGTDIGCGQGQNELVVAQSPPAGAEATAGTTAGLQFGPSNRASCQEGIMGNDEVSPHTDPVYGKHYVFDVHDNSQFNTVLMLRCGQVPNPDPNNSTNLTGLSCVSPLGQDQVVYSNPGVTVGQDFVTMAIDRSGNLYAVWAQAPIATLGQAAPCGGPQPSPAPASPALGAICGPTKIMMSSSTNDGKDWSPPVDVTAGNAGLDSGTNVFPWVTAGDDGRIDIAWYGTTTGQFNPPPSTSGTPPPSPQFGADTLVNADWQVYMAQSLNAHANAPFTASPGQPSFTVNQVTEKPIHYGSIQTVGGSGDRTSGDFLKIRTGLNGEANITYVDSANDTDLGQDFFSRQNGGPSLYTSVGSVPTFSAPTGAVTDQPCNTSNITTRDDASFDAAGLMNSQCGTNLDIQSSQASLDPADPSKIRLVLKVASLASLAPPANSGGTVIDWLIAWHQPCVHNLNATTTPPAPACTTDGHLFFGYMESVNGGPPTFYDGNSSSVPAAFTTYPGLNQLTSTGTNGVCASSTAANCYDPQTGTIVIDVPLSDVASPAVGNTLYSITASTLTLQAPGNSNNTQCTSNPPPVPNTGSGNNCGVLFNTIDSAPAYDALLSTSNPTFSPVRAAVAHHARGGVTLHWRVSQSSALTGFNVYAGTVSVQHRLNNQLIAARPGKTAYAFRVSHSNAHAFWLQAIGRNGARQLFGPLR